MSGNETSMSKGSVTQQLAEAAKSISAGDIVSVKTDLRRLICRGVLRQEHYPIVSAMVAELIEHDRSSDRVLRIAILGSYTTQPIVTAARCALLAEGILADIYEAPFTHTCRRFSPPTAAYTGSTRMRS